MPADSLIAANNAVQAAEARWRDHNTARRRQILDAALVLLDRTAAGEDVTVDDIAREAGLAKSVVYRHFSGRDDLFAHMRTHVTERYYFEVMPQMDLTRGSSMELLTRTISAIAVFMHSHPRWIELARRGPRHDDPVDVDALSSVRQRLATRAGEILELTASTIGVDPGAFRHIPSAVAAMQYGLLQDWLADPQPSRPLDVLVSDLSRLIWHLLNGAARQAGLSIDPHLEISELLAQLAAPQR